MGRTCYEPLASTHPDTQGFEAKETLSKPMALLYFTAVLLGLRTERQNFKGPRCRIDGVTPICQHGVTDRGTQGPNRPMGAEHPWVRPEDPSVRLNPGTSRPLTSELVKTSVKALRDFEGCDCGLPVFVKVVEAKGS